MKLRHSPKLLVAGVVLTLVSACGGGDRPSKDEVADAITGGSSAMGSADEIGSLPDEAVDCIAQAMVDSDLSDEALRAFVDNDTDFDGSSEDEAAMTDLTSAMTECASAMMPSTGTE